MQLQKPLLIFIVAKAYRWIELNKIKTFLKISKIVDKTFVWIMRILMFSILFTFTLISLVGLCLTFNGDYYINITILFDDSIRSRFTFRILDKVFFLFMSNLIFAHDNRLIWICITFEGSSNIKFIQKSKFKFNDCRDRSVILLFPSDESSHVTGMLVSADEFFSCILSCLKSKFFWICCCEYWRL